MKKIFAILALAITGTAFAADYVTVDIDHVKSGSGYANSTAQYVRAGKDIAGLQFALQDRTSVSSAGGTYHSLETTVGKSISGFTPFVGLGFDNGFNGVKNGDYRYTLTGVTTGTPVAGGYALGGVKTRLTSTEPNMTHQTVAFGTYSYPVVKGVAVNLNLSKSYQDIKENAWGLGVGFSF